MILHGKLEKTTHIIILTSLFLLNIASDGICGRINNPDTRKMDYCLTVEEEDGSPSNKRCSKLLVPNGILLDNGDGSFSFTFPSSGVFGYWTRSSTTLSPSNENDNIDIGSGNFTTTGTGTFQELSIKESGGVTILETNSSNAQLKIHANDSTASDGLIVIDGNYQVQSASSSMAFMPDIKTSSGTKGYAGITSSPTVTNWTGGNLDLDGFVSKPITPAISTISAYKGFKAVGSSSNLTGGTLTQYLFHGSPSVAGTGNINISGANMNAYGSYLEGGILNITGSPTINQYGIYLKNWSTETDFGSATINSYDMYSENGADWVWASDSQKLLLGAGKDVSLYFDGSDWIFNSENVTANDEIIFQNFDNYSFDSKVSVGTSLSAGFAPLSVWGSIGEGIRLGYTDSPAGINIGGICARHSVDAEEDITLIYMLSTVGASNLLSWGGGNGNQNSATAHYFYTAANNTTLTGTSTFFINNSGAGFFLDNKKFYFGTAQDVSITFDGSDLIINSENITASDEIHFTNFSNYVFDSHLIPSVFNSYDIGSLPFSKWRNAYFSGTINTDSLVASSSVMAANITLDGSGLTSAGGFLTVNATLDLSGTYGIRLNDNATLSLGNVNLTDSYLKWDTTNLQIFSSSAVEILSDTYWTGNGYGLPFGEIYAKDNTTNTTLNSTGGKVQVAVFDTNGVANLTTPDHTNDHITISKPGKYKVSFTASVSNQAAASNTITFSLWKNNGATEYDNTHRHRYFSAGTDVGSMGFNAIIDCSTSDTLEVWADTDRALDTDVRFEDLNLNVSMVGG